MVNNLRRAFEEQLERTLRQLGDTCASEKLATAMRYSTLGGGKRIRPMMALAAAHAAAESKSPEGATEWARLAMPAALAIEFVHCYSLIHDDLPSMDNDDFRRGKPSCHKAFDEATAILAGDALLSDAFLLLADAKHNVAAQVKALAHAVGSQGMVAGQSLDLQFGNRHPNTNALKTGALFECACLLGGLSVDASTEHLAALSTFGRAFGAAFQANDDLQDGHGHATSHASLNAAIAVAKNAATAFSHDNLLVELFSVFGVIPSQVKPGMT